MRRPRAEVAALCLFLAASALSAAENALPGPLVPPLAGASVRGGDILDLSFRFPRGMVPDEWEAYLSLDGGETYPVRLTGDQPPSSTSLAVRVPNLPTEAARILVRAGGDEGTGDSDRYERDVAVSDLFRIAPGNAPPERIFKDDGRIPRRGDLVRIEWLVEAALPGPVAPVFPDGLSGERAALDPLGEAFLDAVVPRAGGPSVPLPAPAIAETRYSIPVLPAARIAAIASTNPPPLRN